MIDRCTLVRSVAGQNQGGFDEIGGPQAPPYFPAVSGGHPLPQVGVRSRRILSESSCKHCTRAL